MPNRERDRLHRQDEDAASRPATKATPAPTRDEEHPLAALQGQIGNRATAALVGDPGRPLEAGERQPMESSFQRDFGDVRLHEGPAADEAARRIGATAFTVDRDIYLAGDAPASSTPEGKAVLGEELAHVAQGVGAGGAERVLPTDHHLEHEAHAAAGAALAGERASVSAPSTAAAGATGRILPGLTLPVIAGVVTGIAFAAQESAEWLNEHRQTGSRNVEQPPPPEPPVETPETQGLTTEEWERVKAVLPKINAAKGRDPVLEGKSISPLLGDAISVLLTFADHPGVGGLVTVAGNNLITAKEMVEAMADEPQFKEYGVGALSSALATAVGFVSSAKDEVADENGTVPARTTLTKAQGSQLQAGVVGPLTRAVQLIKDGDFQGASDALLGVGGALESFTDAPPEIISALHRAGRFVTNVANVLDAKLSKTADDWQAKITGQLDGAIGTINAMAPPEQ